MNSALFLPISCWMCPTSYLLADCGIRFYSFKTLELPLKVPNPRLVIAPDEPKSNTDDSKYTMPRYWISLLKHFGCLTPDVLVAATEVPSSIGPQLRNGTPDNNHGVHGNHHNHQGRHHGYKIINGN